MTETQAVPLKLIVIYNANRNEYSISKHNQTAEEAQEFFEKWNPHLLPGASLIALDQKRRHRTENEEDCRLCRGIVAQHSGVYPAPRFKRRASLPRSSPLKLVILYDRRENQYMICEHNLTPEEAAEEVENLRAESLPAFTVEQRRRHPAADAETCRACRHEVNRSTEFVPTPQFIRRKP